MRARPYGEVDKIVTFLSRDHGKLTGIAKGAKNSRRRFANCLDTFTVVRVHYRTRSGASLVFMDSCDLLVPPNSLADPRKLAYGSYLLELADRLTTEGHPVPEIFLLLREALGELGEVPATSAFLRVFELHLLVHAGYEPQVELCGRCQRLLVEDARISFDDYHGSMVCHRCVRAGERLPSFQGATLQTVLDLKRSSVAETRTYRVPREVAGEVAELVRHWLRPHLSRPLESLKLIAALS